MNLKKIGKVFTSKYVGTGPSSCEKRIYQSVVSQRLRNTAVEYIRVCTAVPHAARPFPALFLSIQQPHTLNKLHSVADQDVGSVACLKEMTVQVPKS
jgi:hypothetical protein